MAFFTKITLDFLDLISIIWYIIGVTLYVL